MVLLPEVKYLRLIQQQPNECATYQRERPEGLQEYDDQTAVNRNMDRLPEVEQTGDGDKASHRENLSEKLDVDTIITAIPGPLKNKARVILHHIETYGDNVLSWNQKGELLHHEQIIPGSHISDVLKDVLTDNPNFHPRGAEEFYAGIAEINVPMGLLGHQSKRQQVGAMKNLHIDNTKRTVESAGHASPRPPGIPVHRPKRKMDKNIGQKVKRKWIHY